MGKTFINTYLALFLLIGGMMSILQKGESSEVANSINIIEKFNAIDERIGNVDKDTLIILDVDYTLLQPSNPAFQQGNFSLSPEFVKSFMKSIPESCKSEITTAIATSGEGQLLEEETPEIIDAFKQKGARILIISVILAGHLPNIPDLMDWRINNLKKVGIQPTTFGFNHAFQFKEFPPYRGKYPEFKDGVILTNGELVKKHQVLEAFLKKIKWPSKIIFVDDNRQLVEQMADFAKQKGIMFIGFEYKGAKKAKASHISKEDLEHEWNHLKMICEDRP